MERFAWITDLHLDEPFPKKIGIDTEVHWQHLIQHLKRNKIQHIVYTGDLGNYNKAFIKSFMDQQFSLDFVPGNHDKTEHICPLLHSYGLLPSSKGFYSRVLNGLKIIALDSALEITKAEQLTWLQQQLEVDLPILLLIHHPILDAVTVMDKKHALHGRERIAETLFQHAYPITILSGHYHLQKTVTQHNVTQHIGIAASYQLKDDPTDIEVRTHHFGYNLCTLTPGNFEFKTQLIPIPKRD